MTILSILEFPDTRLRARAMQVEGVSAQVLRLIDDLLETMYASKGIGLAAPQVDARVRVVVLDVSEAKDAPMVFVNPEIVAHSMPGMAEESCLSLPGVVDVVKRDLRVRVRALGRDGQPFELDAEGLFAVCIQHEIDHLDGKLFVDRLPWLKRWGVKKRLRRSRPIAPSA